MVGTSVAGVVVTLVALTVSLPVGLATAGFFVAYRFVEDYLLTPGSSDAPSRCPRCLVIALLRGGAIGAVVAIPVAAAILLVVREVILPHLGAT